MKPFYRVTARRSYSGRIIVRLAVAGATLVLPLACGPAICRAKDSTKSEIYDDGKPHFVYSVDGEGRKNGEYRELSPEGHVLVAATYLKGQLNGP
jgi:hypothetical protein